jgi:hypothetical protein
MNKLLLGCFFLICPIFLFAHNPLSSKYYLEHNEKGSFLSVYLSQTGANQALIKKYGQETIQQKSTLEYKELLVDYIKANFNLSINNEKIALLDGGIKLGNHQTDLKFILSSFPKKIESIKINILAFQENEKHQTIFSYNLYGLVDKAILSDKNDYSAHISLNKQEEGITMTFIGLLVGALTVLLILGLLFLSKRAKS